MVRFIATIFAVVYLSACTGSTGGEETHSIQVYLSADGDTKIFQTTQRQLIEILSLAEIELNPGDRVLLSGLPYALGTELPPQASYRLQVVRAIVVQLTTEEGVRAISSSSSTLAGALLDGGVQLYVSDRLNPPPETALTGPLSATLTRAIPIQISIDGRVFFIRSTADSVGDALAEAGLSLQGLDYSLPPASGPIPADGQIRIVRITEQVVIKQEPLPFETIFQPAPEVDIDTILTLQAGEFGLTSQRVRIRYQDGVEVSRQVEDEWVARQSVPRIQGYGTKITIQTLQTPDGPIEYWRAVEVYATSYAPMNAGTPVDAPNYGITFSGEKLRKGHIAVLRSWYYALAPYQYYVPNYGFGKVADIGGGIAGRDWIDLGFPDEEYVAWYSWTTMYFLTPIPTLDQILWILP